MNALPFNDGSGNCGCANSGSCGGGGGNGGADGGGGGCVGGTAGSLPAPGPFVYYPLGSVAVSSLPCPALPS